MGILFRVSALLVLSVGTLHCANKKSYEAKTAPVSEKELGLIVQTTPEQLDQLVATQPQTTVRALNIKHGLYEINNVSQEAAQAISSKPVYKNRFIEGLQSLKKPTLSMKSLALNTSADASAAIETCVESETAPELKVSISYNPETLSVTLGEEISITADAVTNSTVGGEVRFMWDMLAPGFSQQSIATGISKQQTLTPDSMGIYRFLVVAQGADLSCSHVVIPLFVTKNPELSTAAPALSKNLNSSGAPTTSPFKHLDIIQAKSAWSLSQGEGIVVAVIDSGVNYNHPMMRNNIFENTSESVNSTDSDNNGFVDDTMGWDFINNDRFPFDDEGHGSHVAGLVASPVFGVAPKAKILAVKGLNAAGGSDVATVVASIFYAVDSGAHVINASLGFQNLSEAPQPLIDAMAYAQSKNVVFLAAAGNGDETGRGYDIKVKPIYPASFTFDNLIVVASTAQQTITSYSNFNSELVHIAAPGGNGEELMVSLTAENPANAPLVGQAGTSMACPVTAGVVALMLSHNHYLRASEVRDILMETGDDLDSLNGITASGRQVNALKAMQFVLDLQPALATM